MDCHLYLSKFFVHVKTDRVRDPYELDEEVQYQLQRERFHRYQEELMMVLLLQEYCLWGEPTMKTKMYDYLVELDRLQQLLLHWLDPILVHLC